MLDILKKQLNKKQWEQKIDCYSRYFEYIEQKATSIFPAISVIVISWRLHRDTIKNFEKLEKQRKQNFELIFVDNGGEKDEFASLKPYIDKYIKLNTNTGACVARNIGAVFAEAPLLLFLEDDGIADENLLESYLLIKKIYDVVVVRGSYLPKTTNLINHRQHHYYYGNYFFPRYSDLEGNTLYEADIFYQVGGWDDEIYFGSEGPDLALRILDIEPNLARQIYSPISIIHHDYVRDEEHFNNKIKAQKKSRERLQKKHYKFEERLLEWEALFMNEKSIPKKQNINENTILELQKIEQKIMKRNQSSINFLLSGAYFLNDSNLVNKLLEKVNGRGIALFGAGNYGQRVLQRLQHK